MSQARVQSRVRVQAQAQAQAQARVTDFFSQKKKAPVKQAKQRSHTAAGRSAPKNKDALLSSSSVHQEFLRVIDEAVGLNDGQSTSIHTDKNQPCSPRTPKRTSTDAQFDLGAAVFSATAEHSTSKKRRQEAGRDAEKVTRKTARKKLILPQDTAQTAAQPLHSEVIQQASVSENHDKIQTSSSPQRTHVTRSNRGQASKVLSKDDITALKSRLHRIKKHAEEKISTASSSVPSSSSPVNPAPTSTSPASTVPPSSDAKTLKSTLVRAKELAAKAQRRKEERETEESRMSETQSQESAEQPAYQRYHTLAQAAPPGLSLPYQYKVLAEMFRSMDTVVAMMHNRHETSTFTKIKQGVQDMMHKRFEESHVGQIKTVFAEAYTFRQEKNIPTFNSSIKRGSYQLTVEPNVHSDQNEACSILSASRLLERRHIFHYNLVSIVKQHHKVFLSSLVPPVSVPEDKLTRWHPRFNVDTVPAVHISPLPQPPHTEKLTTAQEVLDKACSLITPKMEKALVSLALRTEDAESKESTSVNNPPATQTSAPSPTAPAQVPTALKGVSQSLLDRIRAKESQKLQAAMTRNPTHEDRLLMMSRLGELARILRNVFVAEKKPALIMEVVCNKMVGSYRSALSTGDMEKHIRLLAEVAADWLTIHPIRKDFYLKLNKNTELSAVLDKLSSRLKEEERL
ncbi:DNA replication factor Cdt1 [Scomber japonicus]|uniref:DNA replication factor Cdt1 n=1 Tax=Scomber japonicus TaxID=13676 RepID=UPI0023052148|nr:DNA replication factor Cdt1 [Scomber japonicus]